MKAGRLVIGVLFDMMLIVKIFAQPPEIDWSRTYGGNNSDEAYSVQQTTDGGYIFAGCTKSFGNDSSDVYFVKTNSQGNENWARTYGHSDWNYTIFDHTILQTNDEGYIIAANTGQIVAGTSDIYLIRTNSLGDTCWTRTLGGDDSDESRSIAQCTDMGYVIVAYTRSFGSGGSDFYIVKTDSVGDTLWTRTYGGSGLDAAYSVQQTTDGGYIIAGYTTSFGAGEHDFYLVKIDSTGDTLWTRTYGGSEEEWIRSVLQTLDGGYIIAGSTYSFGEGNGDVYIVKTDSTGDILWTRTYGGSSYDGASSIQLISNGEYIIAGSTSSYGAGGNDLYLLKINSLGDTLWTFAYGGSDNDVGSSVDLTDDGGYIIAGYTWNWELPADAWLVKIGPDTSSTHAPAIQWVSHPLDFALHPAYPNPFNPTTTISFDLPFQSQISMNIYNVLGQRVAVLLNGYALPGNHQLRWDASDLPSGMYYIHIKAGESEQTRKMVLLK